MVAMKNATENAEDLIEDLTSLLQQGPPVQHHPRDDRDRVRRERSLTHRTQEATDTMAIATTNATGRVIQITGPVVDIDSPPASCRPILNAVEIQREGQDSLVCEVQQHLGNNWVRSVAMTTTDGLARGVAVLDTGAPITVPVGEATLGRVFDVLGRPIDNKGPVNATATPADPSRGPGVRPAVDRGRGLRDRPQDHRPDLPVQEGRQDRHLRWGRRRQDGHHPGADPQRRPGALGLLGVRRASASAAARATTSSPR